MRSCQIRATVALLLLLSVPAAAQSSRQAPPNPFLGSVPKGAVSPEPLALSVKDAVQRALENNLGLLLQEESETTAKGARWRALADLLPNVSGSLKSSRQVINLEAYGFPAAQPIVGPFNVHDARVFLSQPVIDLSALNDGRAASLNLQAE
jgi:outer membrane protein TolC